MKKLFAAMVVSALSLALFVGGNEAGDKAKDKGEKKGAEYSISEVMKGAHGKGLLKKVTSGKASEGEKKQLLAYYIALHANTPEKGDAKKWATQTKLIVDAAQAVLEGKEGADKLLGKAVNCGGCHKEFK